MVENEGREEGVGEGDLLLYLYSTYNLEYCFSSQLTRTQAVSSIVMPYLDSTLHTVARSEPDAFTVCAIRRQIATAKISSIIGQTLQTLAGQTHLVIQVWLDALASCENRQAHAVATAIILAKGRFSMNEFLEMPFTHLTFGA